MSDYAAPSPSAVPEDEPFYAEGRGLHRPMSNRLPTGPGSRGGRWHEPEYRREYMRAWRAGHPEYREREQLRRARKRAQEHGGPADIESPKFPRPLPRPAVTCPCDCGCREPVPVARCGFCVMGDHACQHNDGCAADCPMYVGRTP